MQTLGRYQLLGKIAAGGMAEVFLAKTEGAAGFSKTCVVKRILPNLALNLEFVEMFLNEARLSAQLSHPNVVHCFELGKADDTYFMAMEYIDGPTLRGLFRAAANAGRRVPIGVCLKITSLVLEGLAYAHGFADSQGRPLHLVHRDISPHNILIARSGAVKVADFGIAKAASIPSVTKTGQIRGKTRYMSPEQLYNDPLDARTDLFALGITLFEALTGERPFRGEADAEVINAILNDPPPRIADVLGQVPKGLQELLDRALAKERDERYATAAEMQGDVEATLISLGEVVRGAEIAALVAELCPPEPDAAVTHATAAQGALAVSTAPTPAVPAGRKGTSPAVAPLSSPPASGRKATSAASNPVAEAAPAPPRRTTAPIPHALPPAPLPRTLPEADAPPDETRAPVTLSDPNAWVGPQSKPRPWSRKELLAMAAVAALVALGMALAVWRLAVGPSAQVVTVTAPSTRAPSPVLPVDPKKDPPGAAPSSTGHPKK